jgi:hypothetical protein
MLHALFKNRFIPHVWHSFNSASAECCSYWIKNVLFDYVKLIVCSELGSKCFSTHTKHHSKWNNRSPVSVALEDEEIQRGIKVQAQKMRRN